jgi:L-gulonate 3-dehydrogenase
MKIAVIGAGLIGRSWAIVFARGGHDVVLYDANPAQAEAALAWADGALKDMEIYKLVPAPAAIRACMSATASLRDALTDCNYVQENIAERLEPKQALFAEIEALAPASCIFASSSSALMPSLIFDKLAGKSRCLVVHPMNPPHLAPIAEICGAAFTSPEAIAATRALMDQCAMAPIEVKREVDGFILNRLQLSLLNEAFRLIAHGYVTAEDLDKTLKDGLALRWALMGPIETIDLNAPDGVADYMRRYGETIRRIGQVPLAEGDWPASVADMMENARRAEVPKDKLAAAQARRDRRMMALTSHLRNDSIT